MLPTGPRTTIVGEDRQRARSANFTGFIGGRFVTSESSTGKRDSAPQSGEVGLRQLLESYRNRNSAQPTPRPTVTKVTPTAGSPSDSTATQPLQVSGPEGAEGNARELPEQPSGAPSPSGGNPPPSGGNPPSPARGQQSFFQRPGGNTGAAGWSAFGEPAKVVREGDDRGVSGQGGPSGAESAGREPGAWSGPEQAGPSSTGPAARRQGEWSGPEQGGPFNPFESERAGGQGSLFEHSYPTEKLTLPNRGEAGTGLGQSRPADQPPAVNPSQPTDELDLRGQSRAAGRPGAGESAGAPDRPRASGWLNPPPPPNAEPRVGSAEQTNADPRPEHGAGLTGAAVTGAARPDGGPRPDGGLTGNSGGGHAPTRSASNSIGQEGHSSARPDTGPESPGRGGSEADGQLGFGGLDLPAQGAPGQEGHPHPSGQPGFAAQEAPSQDTRPIPTAQPGASGQNSPDREGWPPTGSGFGGSEPAGRTGEVPAFEQEHVTERFDIRGGMGAAVRAPLNAPDDRAAFDRSPANAPNAFDKPHPENPGAAGKPDATASADFGGVIGAPPEPFDREYATERFDLAAGPHSGAQDATSHPHERTNAFGVPLASDSPHGRPVESWATEKLDTASDPGANESARTTALGQTADRAHDKTQDAHDDGQPPAGAGRGLAAGAQRWMNARRPRPRPGSAGSGPWWQRPAARRAGFAAGALIAIGGLAYAVDAVVSSGDVPRGVVVAGVDIGGMEVDAADAKLRGALENRSAQELPLRIGDVQDRMVPAEAGLSIDWNATWDHIGGQPLNPVTRLISLFGKREISVISTVDDAKLDGKITELRAYDRPTVEGTITFQGANPVAVPPVQGRVLDIPAARNALVDNWIYGGTVELPVIPAPLTVQPEAVDRALREIAQPAVSADVVFEGKGGDARLTPEQIATVLIFEPDGQGGLAVRYNTEAATALLAPQLAESEVEPKDATFAVGGGTARVVPGVVGDKVDWPKTLERLPALLTATAQRNAEAVYAKVEPKLTTQAAEALRIVEPMGAFTTGGFSGPSGVNIRTVAAKVNGAVVLPGETFSLNEFTGPRGVEQGYVESGIIDHGRPSTAVGGGISQFATTLYNAAYFAGLEDAGHTEHSYYISRYPAAREATVFDGAIDLKFRNNTETGVYIETVATSSEITVRIWGTKTVNVESITGERTKPTEPQTITLPEGRDCIPSQGAPGFTISDTRVITDRATGAEISRTTRTVKYDPIPVVKCESAEPEPKPEESEPAETSEPEGSRPTGTRPGAGQTDPDEGE
ncbi:VanW family protein [Nocardia puris]|uniref:VanW family protein n=1 Tax=Nocardia puris TaxID=208602 RepID=UPI002B4AB437|nr:VanW family protein [Nocardia puris]